MNVYNFMLIKVGAHFFCKFSWISLFLVLSLKDKVKLSIILFFCLTSGIIQKQPTALLGYTFYQFVICYFCSKPYPCHWLVEILFEGKTLLDNKLGNSTIFKIHKLYITFPINRAF